MESHLGFTFFDGELFTKAKRKISSSSSSPHSLAVSDVICTRKDVVECVALSHWDGNGDSFCFEGYQLGN